MLSGEFSEKIKRLTEIVDEAVANKRKVLVFSQFRSVLDAVLASLDVQTFGPLTGSVPPIRRQQIVDDFTQAKGGAALVSQIVAGGVGLNIQAASVVVICEPQLKPTIEWQAIARARRMGQLESVQVHRLLSEEGVDRRVTEILAKKAELFHEFARVSETAEAAPEAFDISEAEIAKKVVAEERERLFSKSETDPVSKQEAKPPEDEPDENPKPTAQDAVSELPDTMSHELRQPESPVTAAVETSTPTDVAQESSEVEPDPASAWRSGKPYVLHTDGSITPLHDGLALTNVVDSEVALEIVKNMVKVRGSGRFKVDADGHMATLVDGVPTYVQRVVPGSWFPEHWGQR